MANAYKGLAGCPGLSQELYLIILITGLRGSIIIIISTRGEKLKLTLLEVKRLVCG